MTSGNTTANVPPVSLASTVRQTLMIVGLTLHRATMEAPVWTVWAVSPVCALMGFQDKFVSCKEVHLSWSDYSNILTAFANVLYMYFATVEQVVLARAHCARTIRTYHNTTALSMW